MPRVILVANRLPITVRATESGYRVDSSAGGLASGLRGLHETSGGWWIGWPGPLEGIEEPHREELFAELRRRRLLPVRLDPALARRFYSKIANGVLWPAFHYFLSRMPLHVTEWDAYRSANSAFADLTAEVALPDDLIWVHDYHLMLTPRLLRERVPGARIGFFLHVPFPAFDVYRTLPPRVELLQGLLGADLIGFHTEGYLGHFADCVERLLGLRAVDRTLRIHGREVRLGVYPMGADVARFAALTSSVDAERDVAPLRGRATPAEAVFLGIDRLDYTKGVPRRLLAYEQLLERHPELRGRVRFLKVVVPSRDSVGAYREFRARIEGLIGRINGKWATPEWVPVHYMFRSVRQRQLVAMYRAADVMVVTPLRDGMNLIAKEYIASRADGDGVLVLSELAGAADQLPEALLVNPYDVDATAEVYHQALTMAEGERRQRMAALRARVFAHDVVAWRERFVRDLAGAGLAVPPPAPPPDPLIDALRAAAAGPLVLLLDYDGTLVPFADTPEGARPDASLLELLERLAARPGVELHIVSGRDAETLEEWLGHLPATLHAEHGGMVRPRGPGGEAWQTRVPVRDAWHAEAASVLGQLVNAAPGSLLERKRLSMAWHWRRLPPAEGERLAVAARDRLEGPMRRAGAEVLLGRSVLEVRPSGIHKGLVAEEVLGRLPSGTAIIAMGDDRTDEDLFRALPPDAITVRVGDGPTAARFRLPSVLAVRAALNTL